MLSAAKNMVRRGFLFSRHGPVSQPIYFVAPLLSMTVDRNAVGSM